MSNGRIFAAKMSALVCDDLQFVIGLQAFRSNLYTHRPFSVIGIKGAGSPER
jgi:hypothetical protein